MFTIVIFLNSNTLDKRYDAQENKTLDVPPQTRTDMFKKKYVGPIFNMVNILKQITFVFAKFLLY